MNVPPLLTKPTTYSSSLAKSTTKTPSECGHCGSQKSWVLHNVRLRGINRRLCTSCVLLLHPLSFCPSCFQCYDPSSSPHPPRPNRLTCCNCSSVTHSHCLSPSSPLRSSYLCPPCAEPNFSFFHFDSSSSSKNIDRNMALVLLCAANIASASMSKAVIVARADAERKAREAALSRKRAREALKHVTLVAAREKSRRKDDASAELSGCGNVGLKNKVDISCDATAVANANSNMGTAAGLPRRDFLNGFSLQNSSARNGVALGVDQVVGQKSNGAAKEEYKSDFANKESENGGVESGNVQHNINSHSGGGNIIS